MGRQIRRDFVGVVQAYEVDDHGKALGGAYSLVAGADVPDGVRVREGLLEPLTAADSGSEQAGTFDPASANSHEVNEYLAHASAAERDRVLDAEVAGHARKGIVVDGPHATPASKKAAAAKAADTKAGSSADKGGE